MRKKITTWLVLALILSMTAISCSVTPPDPGGGGKPVSLLIWGPFDDITSLTPIIEGYKAAHGNVTIAYQKKDIATYENDLLNALASGSGPDIFAIHNDWLPRYKNKLSPAPDKLFTARDFTETYVDVIKEDLMDADSLYAMPLYVDVLALYYNKDLLGSVGIALPPGTWEEVTTAVKKLTRQDKYGNFLNNGIAIGTGSNVNRSADVLSLLMLQDGTQIYNPARTGATLDREITSPSGTRYNPGVQALEFYTQFANPAKETYTWNNKNNQSIDAFSSGQAAMMISYSYQAATIRQKSPLLNFGIAPVPQIDLTKPKVNFANYFAYGVSKGSPASKEAWDFLKFAVSKESLEKYYAVIKKASFRKDIISNQITDPEIGVFAEGALTAKTFYKPDNAAVEKIFLDMIDDVILRSVAPPQAISSGNQRLGNLLKQ